MLENLTDNASVWVFQSNKHLTTDQTQYIKNTLQTFIPSWAAHGVNLRSDFEVVKDLFILIGVDEDQTSASGCSKDALMRQISSIGDHIGVDFLDRLTIAYVNSEDNIELIGMEDFKNLIRKDIVRQDTIVYNNLISSKKELQENWETPLRDSWHANLVPIL